MSQPLPPASGQPEPAAVPPEQPADEPAEDAAPLNRAERRAKAKKADPSHVGPRGDLARQVRGARPHSKRPR